MSYPYNVNGAIPGPNDLLSQSQGQIQTNFANIVGWSAVDHVEYGAANAGFHDQVTFPVVGDPGSAAGLVRTYGKTSGSFTEIFLQSDGTRGPIQLTKGNVNITGNATTPPAKGHSFLPGGLIIQWGSVLATPGGTAFTFDVTFSAIYSITIGIQAAGAQSSSLSSVSVAGATAHSQAGTQAINYIAIGV